MKPDCPVCQGIGWVCENHPDKPWDGEKGCICGAGMPCICQGPRDGIDEPDFSQVLLRDKDRTN
jgi:hypothetical protein